MTSRRPPPGTGRIGAVESRAATDVLLRELQTGGWGPASWARFAVATSVRSAHQARHHPRAVVEVTALHGVLRVLGGRRHSRWIAISWLMAVTHLGMLGPGNSIGIATTVSIVRANLPAVAPDISWLGIVAVMSDKADGTLARRAGPTQFGHYADALADATFWASFAYRHETDKRLLAAAGSAWVFPVVAVTALSFGQGRMVEAPRPVWLRPAAALQAVIAVRALRNSH